jgi:hypothetical protein
MRRWLIRTLAMLAVAAPVMVAVPASAMAPASASSPYCGITWGSLAKAVSSSDSPGESDVIAVRSGRHACFDRLVIDLSGPARGARVQYVTKVVMDGSGAPVALRGGARLQIVVLAPAYNQKGSPTYRPSNRAELVTVTGYRTFRQVAWAGSFEGQTTIGLGVRARLPFRVFQLAGPGSHSRLVIDVAHRW